jgi:hypothetical protein
MMELPMATEAGTPTQTGAKIGTLAQAEADTPAQTGAEIGTLTQAEAGTLAPIGAEISTLMEIEAETGTDTQTAPALLPIFRSAIA